HARQRDAPPRRGRLPRDAARQADRVPQPVAQSRALHRRDRARQRRDPKEMTMATIRLATPDDAPAVAAIYAPYVAGTPISFETRAPDDAEIRRRIEKILPVMPWLVCEEDGAVRGYAYASAHRERAAYQWSVDVAAYVHPDRHRRGVGRQLYARLLEI